MFLLTCVLHLDPDQLTKNAKDETFLKAIFWIDISTLQSTLLCWNVCSEVSSLSWLTFLKVSPTMFQEINMYIQGLSCDAWRCDGENKHPLNKPCPTKKYLKVKLWKKFTCSLRLIFLFVWKENWWTLIFKLDVFGTQAFSAQSVFVFGVWWH